MVSRWQQITNYSDRGGNRTHDPAREVDSQRVTYKGTFPTTPSRTVRAPFDAHGSPEIGPRGGSFRTLWCTIPFMGATSPAPLPRVSGITPIF